MSESTSKPNKRPLMQGPALNDANFRLECLRLVLERSARTGSTMTASKIVEAAGTFADFVIGQTEPRDQK